MRLGPRAHAGRNPEHVGCPVSDRAATGRRRCLITESVVVSGGVGWHRRPRGGGSRRARDGRVGRDLPQRAQERREAAGAPLGFESRVLMLASRPMSDLLAAADAARPLARG